MRKNIITGVSLVALSAGMAQAGGIELQTLDTSIMYADGNQAAISHVNINPSIEGVNPNPQFSASSKKKVVKSQSVTNIAAKFDVAENLSVGFATYKAGSVQLDGGNGVGGGNLAPTGDVNLDTSALLVRYALNDNISLIGGLTNNVLSAGNVTTMAGSYDISGASEQSYVLGAAYSIPEIALRAQVIYQPKTTVNTSTNYTPATSSLAPAANADAPSKVSLPDTFAVSFQTGIAADTLLTASYRKANWSKAPVVATVTPIPGLDEAANIDNGFADSESFSIGLGRKFSESLSGSITYSKEQGNSSRSKSLFSVSNGSEAVSVGLQYKRDGMTVSVGVSQRNVGDMYVDPELTAPNPFAGHTMEYTGNTVTAFGFKVAFAF